ncbi:hypothetical protein [Bacillus cereus]|uniref:hypothetical protein n=1 Tax=Bacillus cereus TaxID=1396 RepID=UPI00187AE0FD|nr:hypothetical protein [Bacillus cereus]MBE7123137.1 hypothetical protein [Bacillus cereus]
MFKLIVDRDEFVGTGEEICVAIQDILYEISPVQTNWAPYIHESIPEEMTEEFHVFVHADTWEDTEYANEKALNAWEKMLGVSLNHDWLFWTTISKRLSLSVTPV